MQEAGISWRSCWLLLTTSKIKLLENHNNIRMNYFWYVLIILSFWSWWRLLGHCRVAGMPMPELCTGKMGANIKSKGLIKQKKEENSQQGWKQEFLTLSMYLGIWKNEWPVGWRGFLVHGHCRNLALTSTNCYMGTALCRFWGNSCCSTCEKQQLLDVKIWWVKQKFF